MAQKTLGPAAHSALGASSAERWFSCPGSARLCASLPDQPDTIYSREGTRAHALAQHCLENAFSPASKYVGRAVPGLDKDMTPVTDEMAEAVQVYVDTVKAAVLSSPKSKLLVEQKFKLPFLAPDIDGSVPGGTNDACVFYTDTGVADIFDYKHGAGKFVDVRGNKQLLYYALGAQAWFAQHGIKITAVRMTIVQPRCDYSEEKVRSQTVTLGELFDFREDAVAAAAEARKHNAPFNAGPWCKGTWCKGALQVACDRFKQAATEGIIKPAKRAPSNFLVPAVELAPVVADPTQMDSDELGERLLQAELLADYLSCLIDHADAEAKAGRMPTGCKWVQGKSRREWAKPEADVLKTLQRQSNAIDFAPRKLLSVAETEKAIGKKKFADSAEIAALFVKKPGKLQLAPVTDTRPAATFKPENDV